MALATSGTPVPSHLVGANSPSVRPGFDPTMYGSAILEAVDPVEVRSFQTYRVVYTVGRLGLDDTGAIRVAFRMITDAGQPQATDPAAPNYVSATCTGDGTINLRIGPEGARPWKLTVTAQLDGGYLNEGDQIVLTFGDTSRGSPGMMMQTFVEEGYELRVMSDVQATGNFLPLDEQFAMAVIPGPAAKWVAVLPSLRRPDEPFRLGLKAEDQWGNPTSQAGGRLRFEATLPVAGLPQTLDYAPDDRSMILDNLSVREPGTLRIKVFVDDELAAEAGPLVIREGDVAGFWGDLHGQTGETVGVNSIQSYFHFARNLAFLDVSAHQANDFQINADFWALVNDQAEIWNEPGTFTVFAGYEWSGNTAVGGDHNVYYAGAGRPIYRCSHALLEDQSEIGNDANTLTDLFAALKDEDVVVYAHVGGRYANIEYDHDPNIETAVEVHSAWGTFEWVLTDGFAMRRRVGVVCNSDGHKGRPGASYPGASVFGAYGGLTCFLAHNNDRASIMEAQRRRHHYGTTGCHMHMDVSVDLASDATLYARNPQGRPDAETVTTRRAIMGDIMRVTDGEAMMNVNVQAHAGILAVEIRDGIQVLETLRTYDEDDLGDRIRVCWAGAEYRGRGRNTHWKGRARLDQARIARFDTINAYNREAILETRGSRNIVWSAVTTGNFMGFDLQLDQSRSGTMEINTNQGDLGVDLDAVGLLPMIMDAGGLAKRLTVQRLPDAPLAREVSISLKVKVCETGDTPLWICVTTEDGFQAWSSPIYLFQD